MGSDLAHCLASLKSTAQLARLGYAVFVEECSEGDAFDALGILFVKAASSGHRLALRQRDVIELKHVEAVIEALRPKGSRSRGVHTTPLATITGHRQVVPRELGGPPGRVSALES
jgi:hypothetical protein